MILSVCGMGACSLMSRDECTWHDLPRVSHGCRELGGMTRSSEVVMRLNGCDATDGMFDLVFSRPQGHTLPIICFSAACCFTLVMSLSMQPFSRERVCVCVCGCVCVCVCVCVCMSVCDVCLCQPCSLVLVWFILKAVFPILTACLCLFMHKPHSALSYAGLGCVSSTGLLCVHDLSPCARGCTSQAEHAGNSAFT